MSVAADQHVGGPDRGAGSMVPTMYRVVDRRVEIPFDAGASIDEVVTLWMEPAGGGPDGRLDQFAPGQFAMLWSPGVGEVPISLSMADGDRLGFTIRSVGATTAALCGAAEGGPVGLRGPFGRGWSMPASTQRSLVVAGGIGLAPLRMHIDRLVEAAAGADHIGGSAPVVVIGARSPAELLYPDDIDRWGRAADVHVTVDRPSAGWTGEVGLVTSTLGRVTIDDATAATLCGPEIMMRLAGSDIAAAGADADNIEVSMERSMACAVAHCGRCQIGPVFVCRDGPVFGWSDARALMEVRRW